MENASSTAKLEPNTLLERYRETRKRVAERQQNVLDHKLNLESLKIHTEYQVIEDAGGAKNLGSNEDERKRVLAKRLLDSHDYNESLGSFREQEELLYEAEAELDCIKFEMRLFEAMLKEREISHA